MSPDALLTRSCPAGEGSRLLLLQVELLAVWSADLSDLQSTPESVAAVVHSQGIVGVSDSGEMLRALLGMPWARCRLCCLGCGFHILHCPNSGQLLGC